jgi:hypothetical protein
MSKDLPCPTEVKDKDLLESYSLKVVANLKKYQAKTNSWRDAKVKPKTFDVGDLVLLWSPRTESSRKLESKWVRLYVVAKSQSQEHMASCTRLVECLSIPAMWTTFAIFIFKEAVKVEVSLNINELSP